MLKFVLSFGFFKKLFLHCPSDLDFSCFCQKISSLLAWLSGSSETALLILICHIPFCPFLYLRTVSWACFNLVIPHRGPWLPQDIFMLSFLEVVFVCFQNANICRFSLKALWSFQLSTSWYFTRKFIKYEKEKNSPPIFIAFFLQESKTILLVPSYQITHIFLHNMSCWLLYCIHIFQMRVMLFFFPLLFPNLNDQLHFCSFCLKTQ